MIEIKELVCDISNIASFNKRNICPKIEYIDLLFATIPEEIEIIGIADCSLYHQIDDKERYKKEYLIPKLILEAPPGIAADNFVLTYSLEKDAGILSNDRFTQYDFVSEKWLEAHQIKFMIIKSQLILQEPIGSLFKICELIEKDIRIQKILKYREKMEG